MFQQDDQRLQLSDLLAFCVIAIDVDSLHAYLARRYGSKDFIFLCSFGKRYQNIKIEGRQVRLRLTRHKLQEDVKDF